MKATGGTNFAAITLAATALLAGSAAGQQYPTRPIHFIAPSGAGNATDLTLRIVAGKLTERRGWVTVVENKPGANYLIGTETVLKAPADGHTALAAVSSLTVLPSTVKDLPYSLLRDLVPVTRLANLQQAFYASPSNPAKTLPELVAYAKANPGKVNFATLGLGTFTHLAGELVKQLTGTDMQVVPYKDMTGVSNVMNGSVSVGIAAVATVSSHIQAGRLRGLAVLSPQRSPLLPEVPAMGETGLPAIDADAWVGIMVNKGTPREIVATLNREISDIMRLPEVQAQFLKLGAAPVVESPEAFRKKIESDVAGWGKVIRDGKITFD